jgi:hypothetical protein
MAKRVRQENSDSETHNNLDSQVSDLTTTVSALIARVQDLEDTNSIRYLHHAYGYYIDKCLYPSVVDLVSHFLPSQENGGRF